MGPKGRPVYDQRVGPARLDVGLQLEPPEFFADQVCDADRKREAALGQLELEEDKVRTVRLLDARVPDVHVDVVHLI
jgi:hypothetical protein